MKIIQNQYNIYDQPLLGNGLLDEFFYRSPFPLTNTSVDDWYEVFGLGKLVQPDDWWNDDWDYRKKLTITNNDTVDLLDYQYKLTFDVSGDYSLDFDHINSKGNDIRFISYDSTHQKTSYWIEQWNNTGESTVWVNIPEIAAESDFEFYIYYGNNDAVSESNGKEVFAFYDGFDDTAIDYDIWDYSSPNGLYTDSGLLYIINGSLYSNFPIGLQPGYIIDAKLMYTGDWASSSGIGIADTNCIYDSNNPASKAVMLITANNSDSLNVYAANGTQNSVWNIGSTIGLIDPLTADNWYRICTSLTSTTTKVGIDDGEYTQEYTGSWSDLYYIILGNNLGSESGTTNGTDLIVDWLMIRKEVVTSLTLEAFSSEQSKPNPVTYYNDHIIVTFEEHLGDVALVFEYDGDTGEDMPDGLRTRTIERKIQYLTDFSATIPITWWQEALSAGMEFSVDFCNYQNGLYTLIAQAKLQDTNHLGTSNFVLNSGDNSEVTLNAPQSGSAILDVSRVDDVLSIAFKDSVTQEVLLSAQNLDSTEFLNCIRLRLVGLWGEKIIDGINHPSHSKIWLDYLSITADEANNPNKLSYEYLGDVFVDPVSISYGEGFFCFVKNTPLKPFTVSTSEEIKATNEWIVSIIEGYYVNKLVPSFDIYWQTPPSGNFKINPYSEYGSALFDQPYQLNTLTDATTGVINQHVVDNFQGSLAFRPDLTYLDPTECYDLNNGYLENWIVNYYNDYGFDVEYPDKSIQGIQPGRMMYGSTLFYSSFNEESWNYDFNNDGVIDERDQWQLVDYGTSDVLINSSGMLYDDIHANDGVLILDRYSLTEDPRLYDEGTLNYEYSPHFLFSADDWVAGDWIPHEDDLVNERMATDTYIGDPAPSVYLYKVNDHWDRVFFGTRVETSALWEMYYEESTRDWFFEFNYWISNTTESNPEDMVISFFKPVDDRLTNPENVTVLFDENEFDQIYKGLTIEDYQYEVYNEETKFKQHTADLSPILNDFADNNESNEFMFVVVETMLTNDYNQTIYYDDIRITPNELFNYGGIGEKYGLTLDVDLEASSGFDPKTDAKVVNYPFIFLDGVYSDDAIETIDKDYEIMVKVYDSTYKKEIYLHYFWSDDDYINSANNYHEQIIETEGQIDFYIRREEPIHNNPQLVQLKLLDDLNRLVQLSKIRLDREHIHHTLTMAVRIDNFANHFQIDTLSIEGVGPWKEVETNIIHRLDAEEVFGTIRSQTECMLLATTYMWSNKEQEVYASFAGSNEATLYVNDQIMLKLNNSHDLLNPLEDIILLEPGLNKISINIANNVSGTEFSLRFLKYDGSAVLPDVKVLTSENAISKSPLVTGTFGNGLIGLIGFDFDDAGLTSPFTDEPLQKLITNILINELEHRNLFYQSVKQRLLSIIQSSLSNKHQDRNRDWHNEDDPFTEFDDEDYLEIIENIQSVQRDTNLLFHRIFAKARVKINEELSYTDIVELNNLIGELFHNSYLTATNKDLNGNSFWYPYYSIQYTFADSPNNYNYPIFTDFDYSRCISMSREAYGTFLEDIYQIYIWGEIYTTLETSKIRLKLKQNYYYWNDYLEGQAYTTTTEYSNVQINNHKNVDCLVKDQFDNIILDNNQATLLDAFDATFQSIQGFITYDSKTQNEPILGELSKHVPTTEIDTMFGELTVGRNLKSYAENIQLELYLSLVSGTLASLAGMVKSKSNIDEADIVDNQIQRITTTSSHTLDYFKPHRDYIDSINNDPDLQLYYINELGLPNGFDYNKMIHLMHFAQLTKTESGESFSYPFGRSSYYAGYYQNLNIFGESGLPTDVMNDILAKVYAHYRHARFLPDDFLFVDNIKGSTTTLCLLPTEGTIERNGKTLYPSDEGSMLWLKGDVEGLSSHGQSFLSFGVYKEMNPKLVLSKKDKPAVIIETQLKINQEVFHDSLQEVLHDSNSPFYRGSKTMVELELLGSDSIGEYYQLIGFHPKIHGEKIKTDIIVLKTPNGKYRLASLREGKNPYWSKIRGGPTKSQDCIYSYGSPPSNDMLKEIGLGDDITIDNIEIKKFEFKKNGQDVWVAYRKSVGTIMYTFGENYGSIIPDDSDIIKSSWLAIGQRDLLFEKSKEKVGELSPFTSISQVNNDENDLVVVTRTETLDSLKAEVLSLLRKDLVTSKSTSEIANIVSNVLLPLLVLPKAMNMIAGKDSSIDKNLFGNIKKIYRNPKKVFAIALQQLCEDLNIDSFNNENVDKWIHGLINNRKAKIEAKTNDQIKLFLSNIDDILVNCGWNEATLGKLSRNSDLMNSRINFLKDITEFIHHESAFGSEKLNQYIRDNYADEKFATVRSWLYAYLQRKDGVYIQSIDNKKKLIAFMNDFDRYYEYVHNNQVGYLGSGREKSRDEDELGNYNPLLLKGKLLMWMEGILASFNNIDQIFDGTKDDAPGYLPLKTINFKNQHQPEHGLAFYRNNIYQTSDAKDSSYNRASYIFTMWNNNPAVRLLNGATIAGLRSNIQIMIHNLLMTGGVDLNLGGNQDKLFSLIDFDELARKLIDPNDNIDVYLLSAAKLRVPDPRDLSKELNNIDNEMVEISEEYSQEFSIFSNSDLGRFNKKDQRHLFEHIGRTLYARKIFRESGDTSDYTFGDLLTDNTYEISYDSGKLTFIKHVTYWDPNAIPRDKNGDRIEITDPSYPGMGAWVTDRVELGEHNKEHVLVIDSSFTKDSINYVYKPTGTELYTIGAAKIPVLKIQDGTAVKYQVFCNFFTREPAKHEIKIPQKNAPDKTMMTTTLEPCIMTDEQIQKFFEVSGIKGWAIDNGLTSDNVEILPLSNDIEKKMNIQQTISDRIQEDLAKNDNNLQDKTQIAYQLNLALNLLHHSLGQMQYLGLGINFGQKGSNSQVFNRFVFYRRRILKLMSKIRNQLQRCSIVNGKVNYHKVQQLLRKSIQANDKIARKYSYIKDPMVPGRSPHQKSFISRNDLKRFNPTTMLQYILVFGSVGTFALSQMHSFARNIRTQLWQSKIIEFSSYAFQEDTYMANDWSRKPGADGTYVAPDAQDGYLEKRYSIGDKNKTAAFWKYGESLILSGGCWVSDYIEVGKGDIFEYINGGLNGISIAKSDYGMCPTSMDSATSIAICLQNFTKLVLEIDPLPRWM
ncbi:MAG: DUF2341 domain-containing protein, partial [Candidatus Heimdallarchaeota archaeon]